MSDPFEHLDDPRRSLIRHLVAKETPRAARTDRRLSDLERDRLLTFAEQLGRAARELAAQVADAGRRPSFRTLRRIESDLVDLAREWVQSAELVDVACGSGDDVDDTRQCVDILDGEPGFHSGTCRHCDDVFGWCGDAKPATCPFCSQPDPIP